MKRSLINMRPAFAVFVVALVAIVSMTLMSKISFAQQNATPRETPPAPAAPRPVTIPKPVERTLNNGLRVIVIEDHDTALVSAQLLIKNGGEVDPPALRLLCARRARRRAARPRSRRPSKRSAARSMRRRVGTPRARPST